MTWPDPDPGPRIRAGVGLVANMPASAERRALIDRETEKELQADKLAADLREQQRDEAEAERRWYLERHGVVPRSVDDVLQAASVAQDRQDRVDARIEREAAELLGNPPPRPYVGMLKAAAAEREAREAEAEATPASQSDLARGLASLKNSVQNTLGKWLP